MVNWGPYLEDVFAKVHSVLPKHEPTDINDLIPRYPLSFERTCDASVTWASSAPLFNLPTELLCHIFKYIDRASLPSVSLVNTDCRRLAFPELFKQITTPLQYPVRAAANFATNDAIELLLPRQGRIGRLEIHPSVQSLVLTTSHGRPPGTLEEDVGRVLLALPNLTHFTTGFVTLTPSLMVALVQSTVKHLNISNAHIADDWDSLLPCNATFELESLLSDDIKANKHDHFHHGLLALCSKHLRRLQWRRLSATNLDIIARVNLLGAHSLQLRALEQASLSGFRLASETMEHMTALIEAAPNLQSLHANMWGVELALGHCQHLTSFCGYIPQAIHVLRNNTQITKLSVFSPHWTDEPGEVLRIIIALQPTLRLTCLSLEMDVSRSSFSVTRGSALTVLRLLSKVISLEQLCLRVADSEWTTDEHREVRNILESLQRLRRLAFSGDSYEMDYPCSDFWYDRDSRPERWEGLITLEDYAPEAHLIGDVKTLKPWEIFEKVHCIRMIDQTKHYLACFPKLNWLFIGQHTMFITNGIVTVAHPNHRLTLEEERLMLRRIFDVTDVVFNDA